MNPVLLADHAEVHAPAKRGGLTAEDGDLIVAAVRLLLDRQGSGVVAVKSHFVHARFFLSVELWRVMQASRSSPLDGTSES